MISASQTLVQALDNALPQTQCARCGYPGCHPYAAAMGAGDAEANRCPPGGDRVIVALSALLGRPPVPLDPARGSPGSLLVAVIDEAACIGCTLCIQACPVDAIIGAQKRMHAILPSWCSGCELCVDPCPVDCIAMVPAGRVWSDADAESARTRHAERNKRIADNERIANRPPVTVMDAERDVRQSAVTAALARARARRALAASRR